MHLDKSDTSDESDSDKTSFKQGFIKQNVSLKEYKIFQHVYNLNIVNVPKPLHYDFSKKKMVMQKMENKQVVVRFQLFSCMEDDFRAILSWGHFLANKIDSNRF